MKKPLIKALGVVLSAAMICGSVPASVSPAFAAEVSAETTATSEVSVIDIGNEEKESDNSSTDPDDAISVSDNAAEDETGEAAGDDETKGQTDLELVQEVRDQLNAGEGQDIEKYLSLDYANMTSDDFNEIASEVTDENLWIILQNISDEAIDHLLSMEDGYLNGPAATYKQEETFDDEGNLISEQLVKEKEWDNTYDYLRDTYGVVKSDYTGRQGQFNLRLWYSAENRYANTKVTLSPVGTCNNKTKKNTFSLSLSNANFSLIESSKTTHKSIGTLGSASGNYIYMRLDFAFNKPAGYVYQYSKGYSTASSAAQKITAYAATWDSPEYSADQNVAGTQKISLYLQVVNNTTLGNDGIDSTPTIAVTPANYYASFTNCSGVGNQQWTYGSTHALPGAPVAATFSASFNSDGGSAVAALTADRDFNGWKSLNALVDNGTTYGAGQIIGDPSYNNVTFQAQWGNATFSLPAAPARTGYDFTGWRCDQNGVTYGASVQHEVNCNVSYTAQWAAHNYTVKFVSGSIEYGEQSFAYGTAQNLKTLADLGISKPGYTFLGWNSTYTDGQSVNNLTDTDNGKVTLTAQWKANTDTPYTVHRYVQKELDKTNPETDYVLYEAPEGTENPVLGTETKTATTDTSVTEIAVAIPGYDTPDAITKTIAGDGSTTYDFYYNITDTRATLTVNHYYQTEIDGDWVLYDGRFGEYTNEAFTNVFHGTVGESMTPEQLGIKDIQNFELKYNNQYTLVPTETAPKTVVLTKSSEVNYYYKMVKKNTVVEYKVDHYIQKTPGGNYELFETTIDKAELGSTISPALNQKAIDAVNAIEGCKCEKPQLQVVTITQEGMVFKYNYACVKGTPDVISGGSNLSDETINEIAKKLAAGLSFSMDIDGVTYEIVQNPDGTLAIKFATTTDTKVVIPDVIKIGDKIYRITEVYEKAFKDNTTLKEVVISQNVSKIGNSAFEGCTNLEKVTLKEGLITIGDKAFKGCSSLTGITMPATLQKIGAYAFENCTKLKTVKLNVGLLTIGKKAFYNCKALKQVKIPKSVLKIGSYAFAKCAALTSCTFATDSQLMSMGTGVLSSDKKLTKIKLPGKLTAVPSKAFKNDTKLASITIGKSITKIGAEAFNGCKAVKKVTIPTKVQSIGSKAFYGCKSLKNVSIKSKALTSVGEKAFKKCKKGLRIVVPGNKTASYKKLLNGKY